MESFVDDVPLSRQFTVTLDHAAPIVLTCDEQGGTLERHLVHGKSAKTHDIVLRGLKADTTYSCLARTDNEGDEASDTLTFTSDPLPEDLHGPVPLILDAPVEDVGYLIYNYAHLLGNWQYEAQYLVIADAEGNVRWYLPGPGGGSVDSSYLGDELILYGGYATVEVKPTIVGLDLVDRFKDTLKESYPPGNVGSYNHDIGMAVDGVTIFGLLNTTLNDGKMGFRVRQLNQSSEELWTWDSQVDGIDAGYLPPSGEINDIDPYHANSVFDTIEDGRLTLYVSQRTTSQVIRIDYLTKEVTWTLGVGGDFQLLEEDGTPAEDYRWFFKQHDVKRYGNRFIAYDNGNDRRDYGGAYNYTRALELELDEQAKTARIVFEYAETSTGWSEPAWGGMDLLDNNNYLVAMAHCWDCTSWSKHATAIVELTPDAQQVSRLEFADLEETLYRAERIKGCDIFDNVRYCPELE